jgi:hypothetical protein
MTKELPKNNFKTGIYYLFIFLLMMIILFVCVLLFGAFAVSVPFLYLASVLLIKVIGVIALIFGVIWLFGFVINLIKRSYGKI